MTATGPEIILAIARGGLLVAGALAYALGVKNTFTMNVEFYTGVDERLDMPMLLPPVPDLVDFSETSVLIADDVADTGATLALVKGFCEGKVAEIRCAVMYEKPRYDACGASTSGAEPTAGSSSHGASKSPSPRRSPGSSSQSLAAISSNAVNDGFFFPAAVIRPDCQPLRFVSSLSRNQSIMSTRGFARAIAKACFR